MEILNNFGFQWTLFAAQIVNFLIIYFLLKKFLYKPVLKILETRKTKITEGIKQAEESERRLQETIEKEDKILKAAQEQAKQMIDDAKAQSHELLKKSEVDTKKQIEAMLKEARTQITYETGLAEKRLETNVSRLAINFLEKSLTGLFGEKEQEIVMKNALKKLKKAD